MKRVQGQSLETCNEKVDPKLLWSFLKVWREHTETAVGLQWSHEQNAIEM